MEDVFGFVNPIRLINFLLFHLRYKVVDSQHKFIRIAKERGVTSIVVDVIKYPRIIYDPPSPFDKEFTYTLEVTAVVFHGKQVVYQEFPFTRTEGYSLFDVDRAKAAIKLMLLGEKKMRELQGHFPNIPVILEGRQGRLNESDFVKLHQDADSSGVSI